METSHSGGLFTIQNGRQDPKYKQKSTNVQNFNYKYSILINFVTKYVYTDMEYNLCIHGDIIQDGRQVQRHARFTLFGLGTGFYFHSSILRLIRQNKYDHH